MAVAIIMPRQGQSVESCIITTWQKKEGDKVAVGDILFSYETDKSSFDELAPEAGKILAIFREEGDDVPCLENVLVIGKDGEDFSEFIPKSEEAPQEEEAKPAEKKKGNSLIKQLYLDHGYDGLVKMLKAIGNSLGGFFGKLYKTLVIS